MVKMNETYYEALHQKVSKFGYTIMSAVSDEPRSSEHAAYCYTIGLSNYGYPEIMLADCCYGDVVELSDILLDKASNGFMFEKDIVLKVVDTDSKFKAIELLKGIKEELTEQAKHYFHLFRPEDENYNLIYMGKSDEFGIFPDEKMFVESKHIKKLFYKLRKHQNKEITSLVLPQPSSVQ